MNRTVPLHPSLHRLAATQRRRLRLLGLLFFVVMAGTLVYEMAIAFTSSDAGSLLLLMLIGLLMVPVVALLGGLIWYLDRWLSRKLDAADSLLRDCQPVAARLVLVGPGTRAGILAELHPMPGAAAPVPPFYMLINPSFRWSAPPRGEMEVQVYCRELKPGSEIVTLQSDRAPLLGKVVDRKVHERQMRFWKIGVLVLLGATLAGILIGN